MPTDIVPTEIVLGGVAIVAITVPADGITFLNTGYEFVEITNDSMGSIVATIDVYPAGGQGAPGGFTTTDPTVTIAAGATKKFGAFKRRQFNNADEKVKVTTSAQADVTIGVYKLPPNP